VNAACDRIEPLLTPWADGTLAASDQEMVDAHLAGCERCRATALCERAIHGLLRSRASRLHEAAAPRLRERILAGRRREEARRDATSPVHPATASTAARSPWWRLPLAAGVALALLSASLLAAFAPSGTVLAAELAFDHLKCRLIATPDRTADAAALEARWRAREGWAVDVPPPDRLAGLELAGLRRCLFHGGKMAHISYTWRGRPVSLFVLRDPTHQSSGLAIMGVATTTWVGDGHTYALTGDLPDPELRVLARELRR
jgi:anti-sigma factor RsiW